MADIAKAPALDMTASPEPEALSGYEPACAAGTNSRNFLIFLFFALLIVPLNFDIATFRISPYRAYLLVAFIPLLIIWATGGLGRWRLTDFLILAFAAWAWTSSQINSGNARLLLSSILAIETIAAYMLGRALIRNLSNHKALAISLFVVLLFLLPFAYLEATRMEQIYAPLFSALGDPIAFAGIDTRWNMNRSQVAFEHPILFGLFCGTAFSILYYAPRRNNRSIFGLRRAWIAPLTTFFSLSAGAYGPVLLQTALIGYNMVFRFIKQRWKIAGIGIIVMYIGLDILSNRTPFEVIGSNLAFSQSTYFYRVLINQYGMENVWNNPIFGLGYRTWVRPSFMFSATVDNFWLLSAMRYGIPGFLFIFGAFAWGIWKLAWADLPVRMISNQRFALAFSLSGLVLGAATVFLWNGVYVYVLFLLGATTWLVEEGDRVKRLRKRGIDVANLAPEGANTEELAPEKKRRVRRSRSEGIRYARPHASGVTRAETLPRAANEPRKGVRYRRVEPRGSNDRDDKGDPDEGH